jgi:hypothetical protein
MAVSDTPTRRRRLRWAIRGLVALLAVWGVAALIQLYTAKTSSDAALDDLRDIREVATADVSGFVDALAGEEDSVAEETAVRRLENAAAEFRSARGSARSLVVSPLRALPVVGRQIRSFDALAAAAATTADDGSVAVSEASALLESGLDDPGARVAATVGLAETLTVLEQQLEAVDLGPSGDLVGPLQRARDRFATERERALFTIDRTVAASRRRSS